MNISDPSGRLTQWRLHLAEYDFQVVYKKGTQNTQADALSHLRTTGEAFATEDNDIPCFVTDEEVQEKPEWQLDQ